MKRSLKKYFLAKILFLHAEPLPIEFRQHGQYQTDFCAMEFFITNLCYSPRGFYVKPNAKFTELSNI